jgi:hypothetical protein
VQGSNATLQPNTGSGSYRLAIVFYAVVFMAAVLPVAAGLRATEASFDETRCYLPAITQLRDKFPWVDLLEDSLSASPPGYTHLLAGLSLATGDSIAAHRVWHAVISLLGALLLIWLVVRLTNLKGPTVAALLPMICSSYYLKNSTQLTTDNPAMILSFGVLAFVLFADERLRNAAFAFVLAAIAVYVRHISAWVAGPMMLKGITLYIGRKPAAALAWLIAAACVPLIVLVFVSAWGGLVPPRWAAQAHNGISLAAGVYCFSLIGIFGGFFIYAGIGWRLQRGDWWASTIGCFVGVLVFFLADTTPNYEAGRWGGPLWSVAEKLPLWNGRAYIFLPLTAIGGGLLTLAARRLFLVSPEKAILWGCALLSWLATGLVNRQIFHRYYESPILGFWGLWLLLILVGRRGAPSAGTHALFLLAGALFAAGLYSILFSSTGFSAPLIDKASDH